MIRIIKPANGPSGLDEGKTLVEAHEAARKADPKAGTPERAAFQFTEEIYKSNAVKTALSKAQHKKCCYCEGLLATDVEHFRPKSRSQQVKGKPFEYPGYYWLAYTWSNLYMACVECNRTCKRSLFPLKDPSRRNHSGNDDNGEVAMIVDPGGPGDPRDHIRFYGPVVDDITDIGRMTIEVVRLDRDDLTTLRLNHLQLLASLKVIAELPQENLDASLAGERQKAIEHLEQAVRPNAIYSAMVQDFLNP